MAYKIVLPRFGMAMEKAKVIEWKKEIGDNVEKEEAVLVVENEKLTNEIISMAKGILLKKVARIGEDYLVGDTLALLGTDGEVVEGEAIEDAPAHTAPAPELEKHIPAIPAPAGSGHAWASIPMVTHHVKVDVSALLDTKKQLNNKIEDKNQRFSVYDLLLKLTVSTLKKMPVINATFENDGIHIHNNVNLGIANATKNGLIIPVIHAAEEKSLAEISKEAKELLAAAETGRLSPNTATGGTFTVYSTGRHGPVDFVTPVVNTPQVAILGIGRIEDVVVPVGGVAGVRPMIGLSLTYDHRAVDGATAAEFIKELMTLLEKPHRVLLP